MIALVFIDTNILLDFYRYSRGGTILPVLDHIDKNHGKIITTMQVEKELKPLLENNGDRMMSNVSPRFFLMIG